MDIDKLEAGREFDALVWMMLNGQRGEMTEGGVFDCRYVDGDVQPHADYPTGHISPPHYSTDIGAAWEVVSNHCGGGRWLEVGYMGPFLVGVSPFLNCVLLWREEGETEVHPFHSVNAQAETAPLAICRAALKSIAPS